MRNIFYNSQLEQVYRHKGNKYRQEAIGLFLPIYYYLVSQKLAYIQKISKKLHLKICYYFVPSPGAFKSESFTLVPVRTSLQPSSTF